MAPSTSSDSTAHRPLDLAWAATPPSCCRPTATPVNSSTICGPETKATASEFMTTRSDMPSSRAGPETTGPVTAVITGTMPLHVAMAAAAMPHPCRAATPSWTSAPLRGHDEDERDAEVASLLSRFGQAHAVGVGDGSPAHGGQGPADDDVAATHAAHHRGDGADGSLADVGGLGDWCAHWPRIYRHRGRVGRRSGGEDGGGARRRRTTTRSRDGARGPNGPPDFSHSATCSMVMVRSDDLHMS